METCFSILFICCSQPPVFMRKASSRRAAGTLKRPSFAALFAPELRRITIVTAILSACAYGIAFGALQVTVALVTPGLPELKPQAVALAPLRKEAEALNKHKDKGVIRKGKMHIFANGMDLAQCRTLGDERHAIVSDRVLLAAYDDGLTLEPGEPDLRYRYARVASVDRAA